MKHNILLLLAAGSISHSAVGMDVEISKVLRETWDAQQKAQTAMTALDQAEQAAVAEANAIVAMQADGSPSSPLIRQSKFHSRTSQPIRAIPSTPELAPESPSMTAQALIFADRALTAANTPEGQAVLKLATRAASSVTALWQADGATAFKAYVAKSNALLKAETPSLEEIDGIIEESFQADRHCVSGAEDVAKWGTRVLEGFIEDNKDFLAPNQIALLRLRQKTLDAKK